MKKTAPALFLAIIALSGCSGWRDEIGGKEFDSSVRDADLRMKESRTLSSLAKLESSLNDYYKAEGRIPEKLETLIPKYLAEVPSVEIAVRGHKDNNRVEVYSAGVIRDGQIDGTQLKDTGKWGYAFNDRRIIVFVDCTHLTNKGTPWYQERGVY